MARAVIILLLVQSFVITVLTTYAQPTLQQYLHLSGVPHSAHTITIPTTQHTAPAPNSIATHPRPATGIPSFSALGLPDLVSSLQRLPSIQQAPLNPVANQPRPPSGVPQIPALAHNNLVTNKQLPSKVDVKPSSIDSNVLNNLAIALQLLIVSNILNAPPPTDLSKAKQVKENLAYSEQSQIPHFSPSVMPNSKFVGSSSFSEPNVIQTYSPTRNSMSLMSPYEALGPASSSSDSILSQYGSSKPRHDFQSPYSMLGENDLFSMNDLF